MPIERLALAAWKSITGLWNKTLERRPARLPCKRLGARLGQSLAHGRAWLESTAVDGILFLLPILFFALALLAKNSGLDNG